MYLRIGQKCLLYGELVIVSQVGATEVALVSFNTGKLCSEPIKVDNVNKFEYGWASAEFIPINERLHPGLFESIDGLEKLSTEQQNKTRYDHNRGYRIDPRLPRDYDAMGFLAKIQKDKDDFQQNEGPGKVDP